MKLILSPAKAGSKHLWETIRPGLSFLRPAAISLILIFLTGCAKQAVNQSAQNSRSVNEIRSSVDVVKISAASVSIAAGGSAEATVTLSISPGYHVNANPATFPYLIATELTANKTEGLDAGKPIYPAAEKKKFQFADQPLAVYEGEIKIKLPVRVTGSTGSRQLPINMRIQACDQEQCFPPDTLHTTIAVEVK